MEASGQLHAPVASPPLPRVKAPNTCWIGGWVGLKTGLDAGMERKIPFTAPAGKRTTVIRPISWSLHWLSYPRGQV